MGLKLSRSAPHATVSQAINASKTHGQLRRKLRGLAVRQISKGAVDSYHGYATRKERADNIRAFRASGYKQKLKGLVRKVHTSKMKKAAKELAKRGL